MSKRLIILTALGEGRCDCRLTMHNSIGAFRMQNYIAEIPRKNGVLGHLCHLKRHRKMILEVRSMSVKASAFLVLGIKFG
jgi:hypothetical protein